MSQRSVLYQWTEEIRKNMPHLPKPQTKALAAFSMGIAKSESCRATAKRVVGSLLEYKPVVFLVYETGLKDRLKAMVAAVAFAGRAIPVAWRRCPNEKWQMGLVEVIAKTLGWARDAPGCDRKAITVADRGISIAQTAWGCRGLRDVLFMEDGEVAPFDELSDAPGMSWRRRARARARRAPSAAFAGGTLALRWRKNLPRARLGASQRVRSLLDSRFRGNDGGESGNGGRG